MSTILTDLYAVIESRKSAPPASSYTARLFAAGENEIVKKVGEEAVEVILAGLRESDARLASESADLVYHLLVLLVQRGVPWSAVEAVLEQRRAASIR